MRKRRAPHCSHVSHMLHCVCSHVRYQHADVDREPESGHCLERRCKCESFAAQPGYRPEQLKHETVPIEGNVDTITTKSGDIFHYEG